MIVVDVNLPIFAFNSDSAKNAGARAWLESALNGDETVGFPLVTIVAFLRIMTDQRIFESPMQIDEAIGVVEGWLSRPSVRLITPSDRHWKVLADVASTGQARGQHMTDAHIAALTIEHGATLATNDRGFARFPKLKVRYPLAS